MLPLVIISVFCYFFEPIVSFSKDINYTKKKKQQPVQREKRQKKHCLSVVAQNSKKTSKKYLNSVHLCLFYTQEVNKLKNHGTDSM